MSITHRYDRVKETTNTTGTGTYDLEGAEDGFRSFDSVLASTEQVEYFVTDGVDWEVVRGIFTSAATATLSRATILASSNAGNAVNWTAGTKDVALDVPAEFFISIATGPDTFSDGQNNDVTGARSIALGSGNTVVSDYTTAQGRDNTTADDSDGSFLSGVSNTLGQYSYYAFMHGRGNQVFDNASYATVVGNSCTVGNSGGAVRWGPSAMGRQAHAHWAGSFFWAMGQRAAVGDSQNLLSLAVDILTTDATATDMLIGGDSIPSANDPLDLVDNRVYVLDGLIGAYQYGGTAGATGDAGAYHVRFAIKQVAGTTALVGSATVTTIGEDQAAWDVAVTADDTNDRIKITVTGETDKNIHWHGHLFGAEVG